MQQASIAAQRFLRGLNVANVHEAIQSGLRTIDEWRDFLDAEDEHRRQVLSTHAKLHHRTDFENLGALRWQLMGFLIASSPRTHAEMLAQFGHIKGDKLTRTLTALSESGEIAIKKIGGANQYHITAQGLCEVEYREARVQRRSN